MRPPHVRFKQEVFNEGAADKGFLSIKELF
jgi:hypothetical protein